MRAAVYCITAACMFAAILVGEAWGELYRYVDEKGVVSVTDSYANVPDKYRASARKIKEDNRTYGYTPSVGEAIGSERFSSGAWFDYGKMPLYERLFLLARAGFIDIVPIFKAMTPWMGLALFVLLAAYFFIFKVLETPAKRGAILFLVFAIVAGGLFYKYINIVKDQSDTLIRKVGQMRNADAENQKRLIGVLDSVSREGR